MYFSGPTLGIRHLQVLLLFLLLSIGVGMRAHLPVAIVAMLDNSTTANPEIPVSTSNYFLAFEQEYCNIQLSPFHCK